MNKYKFSILRDGWSENKDPSTLTIWLQIEDADNTIRLMATSQRGDEQCIARLDPRSGQITFIPNGFIAERKVFS